MALTQYDLLLTQVSAGGADFTEKYVAGTRGGVITFGATNVPATLAPGTAGYVLKSGGTGADLYWDVLSAGHTQGTDTGTTATVFELDSDGYKIELTAESASKLGAKVDGGATYADFQAKDATFAKVTVSAAPTAGSDLANKTYVDGITAANDAMVFKGTVGTGGTYEIAAFNAAVAWNKGWAFKVTTAGTIRGLVCEVGDLLIAMEDRTSAGIDADWTCVQTNQDGVVIGPASTTDNYVALFSGTTGKLLKAGTGALGTAAYAATGDFATAAQGTLATNAIPKGTFTAQGQIIYASGASTPAALAVGTDGQVLKSGGAAANPSWLTLGTMAAAAATDYVLKSLYDAYSILYADTDNTPAALTVGASTFVGRKATGGVSAMTVADAMALLWQAVPATKTTAGTAGCMAKDANYLYIWDSTNVVSRVPKSTNW